MIEDSNKNKFRSISSEMESITVSSSGTIDSSSGVVQDVFSSLEKEKKCEHERHLWRDLLPSASTSGSARNLSLTQSLTTYMSSWLGTSAKTPVEETSAKAPAEEKSAKALAEDLKESLTANLPKLKKEIDTFCKAAVEEKKLQEILPIIKERMELIKALFKNGYSIDCVGRFRDMEDLIFSNWDLERFFDEFQGEAKSAAQCLKKALAVESLSELLKGIEVKQEKENVFQLVLSGEKKSFYHKIDLKNATTLARYFKEEKNKEGPSRLSSSEFFQTSDLSKEGIRFSSEEKKLFSVAFYAGLIYWSAAQEKGSDQKLILSLDEKLVGQLKDIEEGLGVTLTLENYRQIKEMIEQSSGWMPYLTSFAVTIPDPQKLIESIPAIYKTIKEQKNNLKEKKDLSQVQKEILIIDSKWIGTRIKTRDLLKKAGQNINSYEPIFKDLTFNLYRDDASEGIIRELKGALRQVDEESSALFKTCLVLALRAQKHHSRLILEHLEELSFSETFEKSFVDFLQEQQSPYIEILDEYLGSLLKKRENRQDSAAYAELVSLLKKEIYQIPFLQASQTLESKRREAQVVLDNITAKLEQSQSSDKDFEKRVLQSMSDYEKSVKEAQQNQSLLLEKLLVAKGIPQERGQQLSEVHKLFIEHGYPYIEVLSLFLSSLKKEKLESFLNLLEGLSSKEVPHLEEDRAWFALKEEIEKLEGGVELFQALTVYFVQAWNEKHTKLESPLQSTVLRFALSSRDPLKESYMDSLIYRISVVHALLYSKAKVEGKKWDNYVSASPYYDLCCNNQELEALLEEEINEKHSEYFSLKTYEKLYEEIAVTLSKADPFSAFNASVDQLKALTSWKSGLENSVLKVLKPHLLLLKKEHKKEHEKLEGKSLEELKGKLITPYDLRGYDRELTLFLFTKARDLLKDQNLKNYIENEILPHLATEIVEVDESDKKSYQYLGGGVLNQVFMLSYKNKEEEEVKGVYKPDPSAHSFGTRAREMFFGTAQLAGIPGGLEAHLPYRAVFSSVVDELLYGKEKRASVETKFVSCNGRRGILMSHASGGAPRVLEKERKALKIKRKASSSKETQNREGEEGSVLFEKGENLSARLQRDWSTKQIIGAILNSGYDEERMKKLIAFFVGCRRVGIQQTEKGYLVSYKSLELVLGKETPFDYKKPETLEGLIKLQVKDWITGECDRHPENYYIDQNGKVTGIDEDCCGGILSVPQDGKGNPVDVRRQFHPFIPNRGSLMLRMPGVVTEEIKKSIEDLYEKREQLKEKSRPYLSEEEIEKMVWRLEKLAKHVGNPKNCLVVASAKNLLDDKAIFAMNTNNSYLMRELHTFKKERTFKEGKWEWEKCGWNQLRRARDDETGI